MTELYLGGIGSTLAGLCAWGAVLASRALTRWRKAQRRAAHAAELRRLLERGPKVLMNSQWKPPRPRPAVADVPSDHETLGILEAQTSRLLHDLHRGVELRLILDGMERLHAHFRAARERAATAGRN